MHPTGTLRPTNTAKATGQPTAAAARRKRDLGGDQPQQKVFGIPGKMLNVEGWRLSMLESMDLDYWWYVGIVMTVVGGLGFWLV